MADAAPDAWPVDPTATASDTTSAAPPYAARVETEAPRTQTAVPLPGRGVLAITGLDRKTFLQGLVSNDVHAVTSNRAVYACFLTPQGKYLHDFFMAEQDETLLLETERARAADLLRRLKPFKLRSKVNLEDRSEAYSVAVLLPTAAAAARAGLAGDLGATAAWRGGLAFADPRHPALGVRALFPTRTEADTKATLADTGFALGPFDLYDRLRLALGVPDGSRDLVLEKSTLLEGNLDIFNGVSWDKGCYMGQELTARLRYRGLLKKRLVPVSIAGPTPAPGTPVTCDGRDAGEMRSACRDLGLALLRLELLEDPGAGARCFEAGAARLTPHKPSWLA